MKPILLLFTLLFFSASILKAQSSVTPSKNVLKEIEILKKADLNLSVVQISRISQVLMASDQLLIKNLEVLEGNKSVMEVRLKELKDHKIRNIKGAMSEAQIEKFDAIKLADKF